MTDTRPVWISDDAYERLAAMLDNAAMSRRLASWGCLSVLSDICAESASAKEKHAPSEACESRVAPCGAQHGAPLPNTSRMCGLR